MGIKPVFKLTTASGRFIKTTGNHPYLAKDGWRKVIELSAGQEIAVPREINERVFYGCDGLYKIKSSRIKEKLMLQLWQSLVFSFPGINNYTRDKENKAYYDESDAQNNRQFFKEITRKSYCQNSLAKVGYNFSNKFSARFIEDYHNFWKKVYHAFNNLSSRFIEQPVYADAAVENIMGLESWRAGFPAFQQCPAFQLFNYIRHPLGQNRLHRIHRRRACL